MNTRSVRHRPAMVNGRNIFSREDGDPAVPATLLRHELPVPPGGAV